jgi:hypothetical protein
MRRVEPTRRGFKAKELTGRVFSLMRRTPDVKSPTRRL